jgi:hypothetical protein
MLSDLIDHEALLGMSHVFLVGGFSESPYLQTRIRQELEPKGITVSIPPCPGKSVMLGAVRFGLAPQSFASRVSRFTYGVAAVVDGRSDTLDRFVSCGQEVACGLQVSRIYRPLNSTQSWISVEIVSSADPNAGYVNETSVSSLATLRVQVPMSIPYEERHIKVSMTFGSTEIGAVATLLNGGNTVKSSLCFNETPGALTGGGGVRRCPSDTAGVQFLIDVSTSMNTRARTGLLDTKLDNAKRGVRHVISQVLEPNNGKVGLSTFSGEFDVVFDECDVKEVPMKAIDDLKVIGSTKFYHAVVKQLLVMERLSRAEQSKRVLLVFTDGEDNSSSNFATDADFNILKSMLDSNEGVCSHLSGIFVISVGLTGSALRPLRLLTASGKLELLAYENVSDIEAAFNFASEKIEKLLE